VTPVTEVDIASHPNWAARTMRANYDQTKMPVVEYLQTEAIKNRTSPGYYIG